MGFGQIVGAGINLVDGKKSWASSTCIETKYLMKIYLYIHASTPQETKAMQNNFFIVFKKAGNAGNQLYLHQIKNKNEEKCNWLAMSSFGHNSLSEEKQWRER